eukprot:9575116-Lingulodinium_polyedra.AAC.1
MQSHRPSNRNSLIARFESQSFEIQIAAWSAHGQCKIIIATSQVAESQSQNRESQIQRPLRT